ncbi:hypothetical protein ACJX0J_036157, partial [Zea mays]
LYFRRLFSIAGIIIFVGVAVPHVDDESRYTSPPHALGSTVVIPSASTIAVVDGWAYHVDISLYFAFVLFFIITHKAVNGLLAYSGAFQINVSS